MHITFSSPFRDMTYDYYLKQPIPRIDFRLNQILPNNPRLKHSLNRFSSNPYVKKFTNQEMKFVNERN